MVKLRRANTSEEPRREKRTMLKVKTGMKAGQDIITVDVDGCPVRAAMIEGEPWMSIDDTIACSIQS